MLPEGVPVENNTATVNKEAKEITCRKSNKLLSECTENYELGSFKNPKSWKKSISGFFRNQLRSSKSNDVSTDMNLNDLSLKPSKQGDNLGKGSEGYYDEKEVTMEQKWQSLGKIFRRQSFVDQNAHTEREANSQKRFAVRSVLSSYFGKYKATENANEKN